MKAWFSRLRDVEAKTDQPNTLGEVCHKVETTVPLYSATAADIWISGIPGWLTPIDLNGRAMFLNSMKFWLQAAQAQTDSYVVGIYEALPAQLGNHPSPTNGQIQVRRIGYTFSELIAGAVDGPTDYVRVKRMANDVWLLPDKQYFVYTFANSVRVSFLTPSSVRTSYLAQGPAPANGIPPATLFLQRLDDGTQRPAPLVELRSRYGSAIFGDTSLE
jgi:hypothetical protein